MLDILSLTDKNKEYFFKIIEDGQNDSKDSYNKFLKDILANYSASSSPIPYQIALAMLYSKNTSPEIRLNVMKSMQTVTLLEYISDPKVKDLITKPEIEYCAQKINKTKPTVYRYLLLKPEELENMPSEIANEILKTVKDRAIKHQELSFLFRTTSDNELIKEIYPFLIDNRMIAGIISNENLSTKLREDIFMENQLINNISNLTPKMKQELYQYYTNAYFHNENLTTNDKTFLQEIMVDLTIHPKDKLTPELELALIDEIKIAEHSNSNVVPLIRNLVNNTVNSKTLYNIHSKLLNVPFSVYKNKYLDAEDCQKILDDITPLLNGIPTTPYKMSVPIAVLSLVELLSTKSGQECLKNLDFIEDLEQFVSFSHSTYDCKLLTIPNLPKGFLDLIGETTSRKKPDVKVMLQANSIISKMDVPFEFKVNFLKTLAYSLNTYKAEKSDTFFHSLLEIGNEYSADLLITSEQGKIELSTTMFDDIELNASQLKSIDKLFDKAITICKSKQSNRSQLDCEIESINAFRNKLHSIYNEHIANISGDINCCSDKYLAQQLLNFNEQRKNCSNIIEEFLYLDKHKDEIMKIANEITSRNASNFSILYKDTTIAVFLNKIKEENATSISQGKIVGDFKETKER